MSNPLTGLRIAGFPGRYLQGPGALGALGAMVKELGAARPVLISDDIVESTVGDAVRSSLAGAGLTATRLRFGGECTRPAIEQHTAQASAAQADAIVALGGGKTIDTAKGVARALGTRLLVAPTVASNDAPTSRLIVIYDDAHRLVGVDSLTRNPDVVLVDSAVIVQAPVRFFRAGIGDALSKRFEADQCRRAGGLNFFGGLPPETAQVLANRCYEVLTTCGVEATEAVARRQCTPAVESVIEATVLLSGLGFESGGLSISHALTRGFTTIPAFAQALHGETVAFGTMVQRVLEQPGEAALLAHAALLVRLGLPSSFEALGQARLSAEELARIGAATMTTSYIGNFDHPLDPDIVARGLIEADRLGRAAGVAA
jgi:glycerol dehydrogenase